MEPSTLAEDPCPWINEPNLIHHSWVAKKIVVTKFQFLLLLLFFEGIDLSYGKSFLERGDC